ncbi:MAG: threonine synthase [Clostridia bacterium]|nr:threonine synthase [Clostridia bacterium]
MKFHSTRDSAKIKYSSAEVIKKGLADDGGLFVPESIPMVSLSDISSFCKLDYPALASTVLGRFLTDYTYEELLEDCNNAYSSSSFPDGACSLVKVDENTYSLELWHGPTCAFKDMALQIMPRLLSRALSKTGETRDALILVATSGDTGKAALEGYKNVPHIKISVFYPANGVSKIQRLQMATQDGDNVNVCALIGNFDDIQTSVKNIFSSADVTATLNDKGYFLSSANSINFGRLAPQIVYYFKAYCDLLNRNEIKLGDKINVCVPTGNFGNILAAYIAKLMGLPIAKLICASNSNNILTDFLSTGRYDRNRDFHLTVSPSMDILISSNLERLLYFMSGSEKTSEWMSSLVQKGFYEIDAETYSKISESFIGYFASEEQTLDTISRVYKLNNYLIDTHTAVAFSALEQYRAETADTTKTVVASTASPFKFAGSVYSAIYGYNDHDEFEILTDLSVTTGVKIPHPLSDLSKKQVNFAKSIAKEDMLEEILDFVKK